MYLAAVADLRSQLGFDDMTDINDAIAGALDAAETQLASQLRTEFNLVNVTDTFFIERSESVGNTNRAVKNEVLLSRGFLTAQPTTTITNTVTPIFSSAFDIVQANYGGTGGPLPNFVFALEKGHGIDTTNYYEDTYISVAYSAGFAADGTIAGQYLLTGAGSVPSWLQQAAKMFAMLLISDAAVVTEAGITINTKMVEQQARLLVQPKIRYKPMALDPFSDPVYS